MSSDHKVVSVFGSSQVVPGSPEYECGERLGRLLAEAGWVVVTGGFGGAMAAACRGAREAGGHTVGVTLPAWGQPANPWVAEERPQAAFADRLRLLTHEADGFVALDGGIGTLTEVSLVWSLLQTGSLSRRPLVAIGRRWRHLFGAFAAELIMRPQDLGLVTLVDSPEEAVAALRRAFGD